jgi:hypothetical protein
VIFRTRVRRAKRMLPPGSFSGGGGELRSGDGGFLSPTVRLSPDLKGMRPLRMRASSDDVVPPRRRSPPSLVDPPARAASRRGVTHSRTSTMSFDHGYSSTGEVRVYTFVTVNESTSEPPAGGARASETSTFAAATAASASASAGASLVSLASGDAPRLVACSALPWLALGSSRSPDSNNRPPSRDARNAAKASAEDVATASAGIQPRFRRLRRTSETAGSIVSRLASCESSGAAVSSAAIKNEDGVAGDRLPGSAPPGARMATTRVTSKSKTSYLKTTQKTTRKEGYIHCSGYVINTTYCFLANARRGAARPLFGTGGGCLLLGSWRAVLLPTTVRAGAYSSSPCSILKPCVVPDTEGECVRGIPLLRGGGVKNSAASCVMRPLQSYL